MFLGSDFQVLICSGESLFSTRGAYAAPRAVLGSTSTSDKEPRVPFERSHTSVLSLPMLYDLRYGTP